MDVAMAWLLRDGPRALWVSVWSENDGAQRFYGRYGFAFAGEYAFIVGQQRDREFMYRRPAAPPAV
jgi:ribosomal protein S18 acetylase RimI-like enzyme